MVNKLILTGNVGKAPEVRHMTNGDPVVSFSLATSERWKDKRSGEKKEATTWHNIVIFDKTLCEVAEKHVKKGSKVYVSGPLQQREYTDRDGTKRKVFECVLNNFRGELVLLDRQEGSGHTRSLNDYGAQAPEDRPQAEKKTVARDNDAASEMYDSDVPF